MTRIIAGFAGSLRLAVPGRGTRPTSDRVREAIFSSLSARDVVDGARVVDLYAGSGALGLEATSRGAAQVTLVEQNPGAASVCRRNAAIVRARAPEDRVLDIRVVGQSVQKALRDSDGSWDVALIDPPYELDELELTRCLELLVPRLTPAAIVMVERGSRSPQPTLPEGIALDRRKDYGDTTLWWLRGTERPSELV